MEKINPIVDVAFKKLFGTEENKDLLISLINAIVSKHDKVVDITLLNPYNQKNFKNDKLSILDIKAKGSCGKTFHIEIQIADEADYDKRALYYWAKVYADQLQSSQDYSVLEKVIGIHILNFISIPKVQKYHNVFHITEKKTGFVYFKDLELHTIELKKFTDTLGTELVNIGAKIRNSLDMWSFFLTKHNLLGEANLPDSLDRSCLQKAMETLHVMHFSKEEREAYESHLKWLRIEANSLRKAESKGLKKGIEKGVKKGVKKGLKEGVKKGLEEGIKKGLEEGVKKGKKDKSLDIARALLQKGLSKKVICEVTGLCEEDLQTLQEEA